MSPSEEVDALAGLEERVQRTVGLVARLKQEKELALSDAAAARAESARLNTEMNSLLDERRQVRGRIEKLLAQIDQLSAS
jgi:chromosome segregation ATPase